MRKAIVLLLSIVIFSSTALFAASYDNWVGGSLMGDYETTLVGGGGGVSVSTYIFDFASKNQGFGGGRNSSVSYGSIVPVYSGSSTVYSNSSSRSAAAVLRGGNGNTIGMMAQVSMLGEYVGALSNSGGSGFYSFLSFGMALRQFISEDVILYEGIGLGTVFASGSVAHELRESSGYVMDRESFSTFGIGLTFDFGAKWDFMDRMSLIGGLTTQILWAPTSMYYNDYYGYYPYTVPFLIGFQPYIGVSYNF